MHYLSPLRLIGLSKRNGRRWRLAYGINWVFALHFWLSHRMQLPRKVPEGFDRFFDQKTTWQTYLASLHAWDTFARFICNQFGLDLVCSRIILTSCSLDQPFKDIVKSTLFYIFLKVNKFASYSWMKYFNILLKNNSTNILWALVTRST